MLEVAQLLARGPTLPDISIKLPEKIAVNYDRLRVRVRDDMGSVNSPAHTTFVTAMLTLSESHYEELLALLKGN